MGTDFSNKRIKCAVCGKDYNLSDFRCPKCDYPALAFSNKTAKAAVRIDNYKLEKGYKKTESKTASKAVTAQSNNKAKKTPTQKTTKTSNTTSKAVAAQSNKTAKKTTTSNTAKSSNTQTTSAKGSSVKQSAPPNRKQPAKTKEPEKRTQNKSTSKGVSSKLVVIICVIIVIVSAAFYFKHGTESDAAAESSFEEYIADVESNADDYEDGYPIYNDNGGFAIRWEQYAIEDFDGDGQKELLVLKTKFERGNSLTVYEYENGEVKKRRSTEYRGNAEDLLSNTTFYNNAVAYEKLESLIGEGPTEYLYVLDDRYLDELDMGDDEYLAFIEDFEGDIWFGYVGNYTIPRSEYDNYKEVLVNNKNEIMPVFKEITNY